MRIKQLKEYKTAKQIRISCAYLFRIKINNEYFLSRDEQGRGTFQPVGGVYKYFDESILTRFEAQQCTRFSYTSDIDSDLRLILPRKKLSRFCRWYNSEKERETIKNLYREFKEEVLDRIPIIEESAFETIKYKYCGQSIKVSRYLQDFVQIHFADVVELIPTPKQTQEFLKLKNYESNVYCFATKEEIYARGCLRGNQVPTISEHTYKICETEQNTLILKHKKDEIYTCKNINNTTSIENINKTYVEIPSVDKNSPFTFISYNSCNKNNVWDFCLNNINVIGNLWIDRKNVGDVWTNNVIDALNSPNCKNATLFINKQYLIRSTACYSEAKKIVENNIPHLILLIDIDNRFVINTIKNWIDNDAADKEKLVIFKKIFAYNDNTGHIDNSVYILNDKNIEDIIQTIKNMLNIYRN